MSMPTSGSNLNLTLKTWPVVTAVTIGLCFSTKAVADWFGIELPEQTNVEIVRRYLGWNWNFALIVAQIVILAPALEELIFRGLLFKLPLWLLQKQGLAKWQPDDRAAIRLRLSAPPFPSAPSLFPLLFSSVLFSAAHYLQQPWPDDAFLALFFFALAQCWLYRRTDRIWCPMLNHALFNLTNLVGLLAL